MQRERFTFEMLKFWVKKVLVETGAVRLVSTLAGKGIAILMYHSVVDDPGKQGEILGGIAHSTSVFQQQMELLARDFHPVSLEEAFLFAQGGVDVARRSVVVTFDDGYADNYHIAMPVLNKVGVSATFYITVDCVEKKRLPWPSRLRYALFTTGKSEWLDAGGQSWPLHDQVLRSKAFDRACEHCSTLAGEEQDQFVASTESQLQSTLKQGPSMMTWDEVRGTVKQGHIVGSHSMSHPNMAHINEDALQREMTDSKQILERELGIPVPHFSYPCPALQPHWTERTVMVSQQAGYKTAVTTNGGLVRRNNNPLRLKRIRPSKNLDGLRANLELAFVGFRT
jgi:peptidoglycan/xylan/chitin deacetylase (PgdA/CDA1 family)